MGTNLEYMKLDETEALITVAFVPPDGGQGREVEARRHKVPHALQRPHVRKGQLGLHAGPIRGRLVVEAKTR